MITLAETTSALYALVSVLAVLALVFLFRDFWIDRVRDDLFALRDEMFDYAVENELVQHEAYRELRDIMNGMIRFAHKLTFLRLLLLAALGGFIPQQRERPLKRLEQSLRTLPEDHQKALNQFHWRMWVLVLTFMASRAIVLRPILAGCRLLQKVFRHVGGLRDLVRRTRGFELLEMQALISAGGRS